MSGLPHTISTTPTISALLRLIKRRYREIPRSSLVCVEKYPIKAVMVDHDHRPSITPSEHQQICPRLPVAKDLVSDGKLDDVSKEPVVGGIEAEVGEVKVLVEWYR
jgi:hypothetical protein